MEEITSHIIRSRTRALDDYNSQSAQPSGRLQVYVGEEHHHLVNRLAILMGCKRAEVVRLALDEFASKVDPDLLAG